VLATGVAGIPELVTSETGRLLAATDADDPARLAAAIADALAGSDDTRLAASRAGRARIAAEFDLALQVSALRP